jgi:hypothetical protein
LLTTAIALGAGAAPAAATTLSFLTLGSQSFTVPNDVSLITFDLTGAGGGTAAGGAGCTAGKGGRVQATYAVTPGSKLTIFVAGRGANSTTTAGGAGGVGGGGNGGTVPSFFGGGGGGGASSVAGIGGLQIVAAGGGGCGAFSGATFGGGGNDGAAGVDGNVGAKGGGPGTQSAGGTGGASANVADAAGGNGSSGQGGAGAGASPQNGGGGGGGGGYFGGGGGGGVRGGEGTAGGGGGGSNFASGGGANVTVTSGVSSGDGVVTLTYSPQPAPLATTGTATAVTAIGATLRGTVNPQGLPTTFHFEYGATTAYGSSTASQQAGTDSADHSVSQAVSGLLPSKLYHFRLVATNASGTTAGADQTFTTSADPFKGVVIARQTVRLSKNKVRIRVSCPAGIPGNCTGTLVLKSAKRVSASKRKILSLGRAKFSIQPGQKKKVTVRISKAGRRYLARKGKLKATARATSKDGAGVSKKTRGKVTLKAKKKRR